MNNFETIKCQNCFNNLKDNYELLHSTYNGYRTDMFWSLIRCNECKKLSLYESGIIGFKDESVIFTGAMREEAGEIIHGISSDGKTIGNANHIYVSCAIIEDKDNILICKRSANIEEPGKWEFPGGKSEKLEDSWETLVREIKEELNVTIVKKFSLLPIEHKLSEKTLRLHPFVCEISSGEITLNDHDEYQWVKVYQLGLYDLLEADIKAVDQYLEQRMTK